MNYRLSNTQQQFGNQPPCDELDLGLPAVCGEQVVEVSISTEAGLS